MIDEIKKIFIDRADKKLKSILSQINANDFENFQEYKSKLDSFPEIKELESLIEKYQSATVLEDFGLDLESAINLLKENNVPIVLTENDKIIKNNPANYKSKEDFICVHKTDYMPNSEKIETAKNAGAESNGYLWFFKGSNYKVSCNTERSTVHTCVNSEVSSHIFGNWDTKKYAVLIPLKDIKNEQIGGALSVDLFTKGDIQLTDDCWILCPEDEVENLKKANPHVQIMGYEGNSVTGYANSLISNLGYHVETALDKHWENQENQEKFYEILKQEHGIENIGKLHMDTEYRSRDESNTKINAIVQIYDYINKQGLITEPEDIFKLKESFTGFNSIYENPNLFFEQMEKIGLGIPKHYQTIIKSKEEIEKKLLEGEKVDFDNLIENNKNISTEDKIIIEKFSNSLNTLAEEKDTEQFDNLFDKFTNFIATSNIDSVKDLKQNNFYNMQHSFFEFTKYLDFDNFCQTQIEIEKANLNNPYIDTRYTISNLQKYAKYLHGEKISENETIFLGNGNNWLIKRVDKTTGDQSFTITKDYPSDFMIYLNSSQEQNKDDEKKGFLRFSFVDKSGNHYDIDYTEKSLKPIMRKNYQEVEENDEKDFLEKIPKQGNISAFIQYFNKIRFNNFNVMLNENLSNEDPKLEKKHPITTEQETKQSDTTEQETKWIHILQECDQHVSHMHDGAKKKQEATQLIKTAEQEKITEMQNRNQNNEQK